MAVNLQKVNSLFASLQQKGLEILWQANPHLLPLWKRIFVRTGQISVAVVRDLIQGQLSLRAMSLVFTTLIGFFPLLALTFAILKGLGVHNAMEPTLLTLLEPLGDRRDEITGQILGYVDAMQVELIGITSVGLLLYIIIDMMRKIELSFNYIWSVKQSRSWSSRISEYLFAVIVSPLLLFLSISITSSVNTSFFQSFLENLSYGGLIIQVTAFLAPIFLMSLAFAFAYSFLPNTKVQFSSAFIGGLITTIAWKLMGSVFQGFFVSSARESIYLAFATAIIVMIFTYIGWLVALVGSSIAFYHQYPAKARNGREQSQTSAIQHEQICLAVAAMIIRRFQEGGDALSEDELADALSSTPIAVDSALHALESIKLITKTNQEPIRYLPCKSVSECSIVDVWKQLRHLDSDDNRHSRDSADINKINAFQHRLDEIIEQELGNEKFF